MSMRADCCCLRLDALDQTADGLYIGVAFLMGFVTFCLSYLCLVHLKFHTK